MKVEFTCKYCNYKWNKTMYSYESNNDFKCLKCGDTDPTAKDLTKEKIDYYQGSPKFEEKPKKEDPAEILGWYSSKRD